MSTEIIIALIALAGSVFAVIMSFIIAMTGRGAEFAKMKIELNHAKSAKLLEKRHDKYPKLYRHISHYGSLIKKRTINIGQFEQFYDGLREFDSEIALLLSTRTTRVIHELQKQCYRFLQKTEEEKQYFLKNNDLITSLVRKMGKIEVLLRAEIGVYTDELEGVKLPGSWGEAEAIFRN